MPEGIRMRQQEPYKRKKRAVHGAARFDYLYDGLSLLFDFLIVHILDIVITGTRVGAAVG